MLDNLDGSSSVHGYGWGSNGLQNLVFSHMVFIILNESR